MTDVPADDEWLGAAERVTLACLRIPKRRADWRLGRWTAKRAVSRYIASTAEEVEPRRIEILAAESGAPQAFVDGRAAPVVISLSHSAGRALCAVAPAGVALGCDIEVVEPRHPAFVADYFTAEEQALIAGAMSPDEHAQRTTILWCAKESALKALQEGLRANTRSVVVTPQQLRNDPDWQPLAIDHPAGDRRLRGWWRRDGRWVLTVVSSDE